MITSTSNPTIKEVRKLSERKYRQQSDLFYLEGLRLVGEAVQTGAQIEQLIYAPELLSSQFGGDLVMDQAARGIPVIETSTSVFRSLAMKENPQGIAAVLHQRWHSLSTVDFSQEECLWVALDSIQNPGNLGTILRTGDAFGAEGILLLDHSTDPYDPAAVRSSMGAIFSQKLVRLTLEELAAHLQQNPITMVGASGASSINYFQVHFPSRMVLLMGSEREGLAEKHFQLCDYSVRIPMVGRSDSLNVSIAAAVILAEISKQRLVRK